MTWRDPTETGRPLFRLLLVGVLGWVLSALGITAWFFLTVPDPGLMGVAMPFYAWLMGYAPGGVLMLLYGAIAAARRRFSLRAVLYAALVYFLPVLGAAALFHLFTLTQPSTVSGGDLPMMASAFGGPIFFLLYLAGLSIGYARRARPLGHAVLASVALPAAGVLVQALLLAAYAFTAPHWENRKALALEDVRLEWRDPGLTVHATLVAREARRVVMHAFYRDRRGESGRGEPVQALEIGGRRLVGQEWTRRPLELAPGSTYRLTLVWDGLRTTSRDSQREVFLRVVAGEDYHRGDLVREFRLAADPDAATLAALDGVLSPVTRGGRTGYENRVGRIVIAPAYDWAGEFREGLALVRVGDKWGFVDTAGKLRIPLRYDGASGFSEGLAAVREGPHMGYIDVTGKLVIPLAFDHAHPFSDGLARVRLAGREGYIDRAGRIVITPQWEWAQDFASGHAGVRIGEKWGFIDKTGRLVLEAQFDAMQCCERGRASAMRDGNWGYIDAAGRFVTTER